MKTIKRSKFLFCLLALALTALLTAGCSSKKTSGIQVDAADLARQLSEKTVTSETLAALSESLIPSIYLLKEDTIEQAAAFASSGATSCETAVFRFKDASSAEAAKTTLQNHVKTQTDLFASYAPKEAEKLNKAIIKVSGVYAVLCVCDDPDQAETILKNAGF